MVAVLGGLCVVEKGMEARRLVRRQLDSLSEDEKWKGKQLNLKCI